MKIIFGCSTCSQRRFSELTEKYNISGGHAIQKYNLLLLRGLAANGAEVRCVSGLPINRSVTSKKLIHEPDECADNIFFHYITTLNLPVFRQLMIFLGTLCFVLRTKKEKDTFAVCDCLNIACSYGMLLGCRLKRIKTAVIVTDLPDMEHSGGALKRVNNRIFDKADAFILLTEQMNKRVNPKGRPHIVLEGHADSEAPRPDGQIRYEESGKKVILYAGSIHKMYGIASLTQGFLEADIPNSELHIYGNGDFTGELKALCEQHGNVLYKGIADNAEIVRQEQRASLLVNPRPSKPEYTKYSFPSKNMEYMVSGTPLLTTDLPGMPEEYKPYVYLLQDESPQGVCRKLREIFALPYAARLQKGAAARRFVLEHKSNVAQSRKILEFLSNTDR